MNRLLLRLAERLRFCTFQDLCFCPASGRPSMAALDIDYVAFFSSYDNNLKYLH